MFVCKGVALHRSSLLCQHVMVLCSVAAKLVMAEHKGFLWIQLQMVHVLQALYGLGTYLHGWGFSMVENSVWSVMRWEGVKATVASLSTRVKRLSLYVYLSYYSNLVIGQWHWCSMHGRVPL